MSAFYGLNLRPYCKYVQVVTKPLHISSVALDEGDFVKFYLTIHNRKYTVATLSKCTPQAALDLNFSEGDRMTFQAVGFGSITILGYVHSIQTGVVPNSILRHPSALANSRSSSNWFLNGADNGYYDGAGNREAYRSDSQHGNRGPVPNSYERRNVGTLETESDSDEKLDRFEDSDLTEESDNINESRGIGDLHEAEGSNSSQNINWTNNMGKHNKQVQSGMHGEQRHEQGPQGNYSSNIYYGGSILYGKARQYRAAGQGDSSGRDGLNNMATPLFSSSSSYTGGQSNGTRQIETNYAAQHGNGGQFNYWRDADAKRHTGPSASTKPNDSKRIGDLAQLLNFGPSGQGGQTSSRPKHAVKSRNVCTNSNGAVGGSSDCSIPEIQWYTAARDDELPQESKVFQDNDTDADTKGKFQNSKQNNNMMKDNSSHPFDHHNEATSAGVFRSSNGDDISPPAKRARKPNIDDKKLFDQAEDP